MYGRGVRLLTQPALSTAPGVGPGTYRVDDGRRHAGGEVAALVIEIVHSGVQTVHLHIIMYCHLLAYLLYLSALFCSL